MIWQKIKYWIIAVAVYGLVFVIKHEQPNLESLVIGIIFVVAFAAGCGHLEKAIGKDRLKVLKEIDPFLKGNGFSNSNDNAWVGNYGGRQFTIRLFYPSGLMENVALCIQTPNRTGNPIEVVFNNKKQMEKNKLGLIYKKLELMGMCNKAWKGSVKVKDAVVGIVANESSFAPSRNCLTIPTVANESSFAPWPLFNIDAERVCYILPGSMANLKNFTESMDIICDTANILGV